MAWSAFEDVRDWTRRLCWSGVAVALAVPLGRYSLPELVDWWCVGLAVFAVEDLAADRGVRLPARLLLCAATMAPAFLVVSLLRAAIGSG
jgi:hypothetical protein